VKGALERPGLVGQGVLRGKGSENALGTFWLPIEGPRQTEQIDGAGDQGAVGKDLQELLELFDGLPVSPLKKAHLSELEGGDAVNVSSNVSLAQPLEVGEGVIIQTVFLESQSDQELRCRVAVMPGEQECEAFQFGDGTVVLSEPEEVQTKGV
jgi:hypothetical protein